MNFKTSHDILHQFPLKSILPSQIFIHLYHIPTTLCIDQLFERISEFHEIEYQFIFIR